MIIDCLSDPHGAYPELEGGDLLIVAGDLTSNDTAQGWDAFYDWINDQVYTKKIVIAGNHDNMWKEAIQGSKETKYELFEYLCDSGTEFHGLKIWGSPWTKQFEGQNPHCMAFSFKNELDLEKKWDLIPEDTNILITHSPPYGILDTVNNRWKTGERVGSHSLKSRIQQMHHLKLHVFGHIHSGYGQTNSFIKNHGCDHTYTSINAAHMNEDYDPVNKPIRIVL